ncbi:MAG: hypothetical protein RI897_854 [Verrucomicrobiota bacterium]|jgi:hypothetical protein
MMAKRKMVDRGKGIGLLPAGLLVLGLAWLASCGRRGGADEARLPSMERAVAGEPAYQAALEVEDWEGVLTGLASSPVTNSLERLAVVRALYEAGRLPEDLFSWIHRPGPELLSTVALREESGSAHAAAVALELGHLNVAERWAFDSLEMESMHPMALRTLVRLHAVKSMPEAAGVFLGNLERRPEQQAWAAAMGGVLEGDLASVEGELGRLRANLLSGDEIVNRLSTESLLGQAYAAHPDNRMAFEFLVVQLMLGLKLEPALEVIAGSGLLRGQAVLPRHYGEAVLLQEYGKPGSAPGDLRSRVGQAVEERFSGFRDFMIQRGSKDREAARREAWAQFGDTYWYYYYFGALHPGLEMRERVLPAIPAEELSLVSEAARADGSSGPVEGGLPRIFPDYMNVTIPPNLAPLNLVVREPGTGYRVRLSGGAGEPIELEQDTGAVRLPAGGWKALLAANRGGALRWEVSVRNEAGEWVECEAFTNWVAEAEIDSHLVYRRLKPLYTYYKDLGIYERSLETFFERPLLRNEKFNNGCLNCHEFSQGDPERFVIALRLPTGTPTLLVTSNGVSRLNQKVGYTSWHPNGDLLVFSINTISQFFHVAGEVNRDIYDPRSDLVAYHLGTGQMEKPGVIGETKFSENWPCWSPDGRYLYFCRGPYLPLRHQDKFRQDLVRVPYDPATGEWGEVEVLFKAADYRLSANEPRVSPDGHRVVFTVADAGCFPVFRSDSDLYQLDLRRGVAQPLEINSRWADTWHCWSANGEWLVFGSKRLDGVFTRVFITRAMADGSFSKPLLLPQEDPSYYELCLDNFNRPELVRGAIRVDEADLLEAMGVSPEVAPALAKPLDDAVYIP